MLFFNLILTFFHPSLTDTPCSICLTESLISWFICCVCTLERSFNKASPSALIWFVRPLDYILFDRSCFFYGSSSSYSLLVCSFIITIIILLCQKCIVHKSQCDFPTRICPGDKGPRHHCCCRIHFIGMTHFPRALIRTTFWSSNDSLFHWDLLAPHLFGFYKCCWFILSIAK